MKKCTGMFCLLLVLFLVGLAPVHSQPAPMTAVKVGRLIDPETGTAAINQVILIEGEKIKAVGPNLRIPAGTVVIDLSKLTVLPGLVMRTRIWR